MSQSDYPNLFQAGDIGGLDLACRIVTAPMTRVSAAAGGLATGQMQAHYRAFAEGGFPLIISEGTYTDKEHSQGYLNQPGITDQAQIDAWARVTEAVHGAGGRIFQQLMHAGALSQHNDYVDGTRAPSSIQPVGEMAKNYFGDGPYQTPAALTTGEIEKIKAAFSQAAENAVAAGFDGIEIHGANGYLLHQFFSTATNRRDDAYGGSAENRARFHAEILAAAKAGAGGVPVGMRLSQMAVNNFEHVWEGGADDARALFSTMDANGADYLHINSVPAFKPVFDGDRTLAAHAREYFSGPVIACGGMSDAAAADGMIGAGDADFVAMARGALADPGWPNKIAAGDEPRTFDPGMTLPLATLDNTQAWRAQNA